MSRFVVSDLALSGLKLLERKRICDGRGFLTRLFCSNELANVGWHQPIAQINHTLTVRSGTVRGMHYQLPPNAEAKLVTCIRGEVWDVAVDLRAESPSFLNWHAEILTADNNRALLIPEGFAHGFQALSDGVELLYCHSVAYSPTSEAALNAEDPRLAITWPLDIVERSVKDAALAMIDTKFHGVRL